MRRTPPFLWSIRDAEELGWIASIDVSKSTKIGATIHPAGHSWCDHDGNVSTSITLRNSDHRRLHYSSRIESFVMRCATSWLPEICFHLST